jgi:hypothetical protein
VTYPIIDGIRVNPEILEIRILSEILQSPKFGHKPPNLRHSTLIVFKHLLVEYENISMRRCNVPQPILRREISRDMLDPLRVGDL